MTNADGYVFKYCPKHPRAKNGFVPAHQLVMEQKIGRLLNTRTEHVHHIDENPSNNNPENLLLVSPRDHRRIHAGWMLVEGEWVKPCRGCDRMLPVPGDFYRRGSGYSLLCRICDSARTKIIKATAEYKAKAAAYQRARRHAMQEAA